ncbi:MAG TPA: YcnI family protein [Terrimesophilobacter sp.]|nr:YcnI family protein [Terrimesophilobacter sp.]HRQ01172.1 YcnI family protein [Terrimesophilobacter sp.]
MKTGIKAALAVAAGTALSLSAPLAASAHVTVDPTATGAGSYTVLTFAIPHGCDGSATTSISISIPEQVASVTPTVNPGWDVSLTRDGDRVVTVDYTAHTPLPNELRDTFELSLRLPDGAVGDTLAFPVLQSCVEGSVDWASLEPGAAAPAPVVALTESTGGGHDHNDTHSVTDDQTSTGNDHDDHGEHGEHGEAAESGAHAAAPTVDSLARIFGVAGLAVGAAGIVVAVAALRRGTASAKKEVTE